jgi:hemerythrin superfamily protein
VLGGAQPERPNQFHNQRRCIAVVQTFVQSSDDVVKFLKDQHNLIKDMFEEVFSASDSKAREKAFIDLRKLLAVHETAEEMVVHPRVRHEAAKGDEIVDARLKEEHKAKETLSKLEGMDIDSPKFIEELTKFRDAVIDHAEHEENEEFAKLGEELSNDQLESMGRAAKLTEAIAPTRPHAGVESQVANLAAGPFAAMLDRARDAIMGKG